MNQLRHASSPYLLQHAENPVHWWAWGEAAWQAARERQQLVVVSIGYSACHWCHVMEQEVFEDAGAADVMNAHFVSIKVDREERPDVDAVYMTAVQLMTGQGGWPLNAVCLPDGRPVWGATYLPRAQWEASLLELVRLWRTDRSAVVAYAERLASGVRAVERLVEVGEGRDWLAAIDSGLAAWMPHWDERHGGSAGAPKFPMPFQGLWLTEQGRWDARCAVHARRTLLSILRGGLHDFAGGGFARYAVDEAWRLPHFEKMLSDQGPMLAWLASASADGGLSPGERDELALAAARLVLGVCRDFGLPNGGFRTAWDADSEGQEGRYCWWTAEECAAALAGDDLEAAMRFFDWSERARFEELGKGAVVPMRRLGDAGVASGVPAMLDAVHAARVATRVPPAVDDKVVACHTAWMAWGLLRAGVAWERADWVERGCAACSFLAGSLQKDGQLFRIWQGGAVRIAGTLEDYAAATAAALEAFSATGDARWAVQAADWARQALAVFRAPDTPLLRFAAADDTVFVERIDRVDDVLPSANAVMASNLHLLGAVFALPEWMERAEAMVQAASAGFSELPSACMWAHAAGQIQAPFLEVVVAGPADAVHAAIPAIRRAVGSSGFVVPLTAPEAGIPLLAHRFVPDALSIYPCTAGACRLPFDAVGPAVDHIESLLAQRS